MANHNTLPGGYLREYQLIGDRNNPTANPPLIPIDHSTLWRWVRQGEFPEPIKLGRKVTAWPVHAVLEWMRQKGGMP